MAEFIPAPNTVLLIAAHDWIGQHVENTLWFKKRTGAPDIPTMLDLGDLFNAFWIAAFLPSMSEEIAYRGCVVIDQTTETSAAVEVPVTATPGGIASPAVPNNVTFAITFLTAGRGKSSRGRNYVLGLVGTDVVQSKLDAGVANTFNGNYQLILSSSMDADWEWSVVSHRTGGLPRTEALVQPVIGTRYHDLTVDSQRRRLPGRGT